VPALAAALRTNAPVIALHLTRPPVEVPDREALGIDSYLLAGRGAYLLKDWTPGKPKRGVVIVQGTSVVSNIVKILPKLRATGPNVKIVCAVSRELFMRQDQAWRDRVLPAREFTDSMVCANQARALLRDWIPHRQAEAYALTPDWDNRWRTGGSLEEIVAEAHLDADSLMAGIERFASEREKRIAELRAAMPAE
jgi:transketolase